jgi:hypothetical protein
MSTLKVNQITDLNNAEIYEPNLMTAQSATGTSVTFTDIPSWVKRITVMFIELSTNGSSSYIVQLGDSGGFETTGYLGATGYSNNYSAHTTGLGISHGIISTVVLSGSATITLINPSTNTWTWASSGAFTSPSATTVTGAGRKTLSDTLTQVRITTVNGTDTFDAGTINVMYE